MSFLNPVNEPVLHFKSTDVGAPQISYNARTAGDIKAVLKACLDTGYGTTASAGWSTINEVGNVAEFVSPSAAMADYRLGVDDSTNTKTTWFYQYQDVRVDPLHNAVSKSFNYANLAHASNGWQLLVTERGIVFLEFIYHTAVNKLSCRLTYLSQVKSGLINTLGSNMMFFNLGHGGTAAVPNRIFEVAYAQLRLGTYTTAQVFTASPFNFAVADYTLGESVVDIVSTLYLASADKKLILGSMPALLIKTVNQESDMFDLKETTIDSRPVLSVFLGYTHPSTPLVNNYSRNFLIYLDYWEY